MCPPFFLEIHLSFNQMRNQMRSGMNWSCRLQLHPGFNINNRHSFRTIFSLRLRRQHIVHKRIMLFHLQVTLLQPSTFTEEPSILLLWLVLNANSFFLYSLCNKYLMPWFSKLNCICDKFTMNNWEMWRRNELGGTIIIFSIPHPTYTHTHTHTHFKINKQTRAQNSVQSFKEFVCLVRKWWTSKWNCVRHTCEFVVRKQAGCTTHKGRMLCATTRG